LYLHWFDLCHQRNNKVFHGKDGPLKIANARLIRFADDFVIMARYVGERITIRATSATTRVENKIETWLGLTINRDKTKVVQATRPGETLDFLATIGTPTNNSGSVTTKTFAVGTVVIGIAFRRQQGRRSHRDRHAMRAARAKIHELTCCGSQCSLSGRWCCLPITEVVRRLNH